MVVTIWLGSSNDSGVEVFFSGYVKGSENEDCSRSGDLIMRRMELGLGGRSEET